MNKLVSVLFSLLVFIGSYSASSAQSVSSQSGNVGSAPHTLQANPEVKAWILAENNSRDTYEADARFAYNSSGGTITFRRNETGSYDVVFAGLSTQGGVAHVTAFRGGHSCNVGYWGADPVTVRVYCYNAEGSQRVDGSFTLLFYAETGTNAERRSAYLWADQPAEADYVPNVQYQWNASGVENRITRSGPGQYQASIPGIKPNTQADGTSGTALVTAYGDTVTRCTVWGLIPEDQIAHIRCFDATGQLADSRFTLSYMADVVAGKAGQQGAYVWSRLPLNQPFIFSSAGSTLEVQKTQTGVYLVTLKGLKSSSTSTAIVTAATIGDNPYYCTVMGWADPATTVDVRCFDKGQPVDADFFLLYLTN